MTIAIDNQSARTEDLLIAGEDVLVRVPLGNLSGGVQHIPLLPGDNCGRPVSINKHGNVVGYSSGPNGVKVNRQHNRVANEQQLIGVTWHQPFAERAFNQQQPKIKPDQLADPVLCFFLWAMNAHSQVKARAGRDRSWHDRRTLTRHHFLCHFHQAPLINFPSA